MPDRTGRLPASLPPAAAMAGRSRNTRVAHEGHLDRERPLLPGLLAISLVLAWLAAGPLATWADEPSKFDRAVEDLEKQDGLWTSYHSEKKLLIHLKGSQLDREYIVIPSIARGISRGNVLGGMSWDFEGDAIWSFRKVADAIHVVQPNVRFRADAGSPEADAVKLAYSDSVIYSLPIIAEQGGGYLVDMTGVFMSDDLKIGRQIGSGFGFARDRSTLAKVASFPENLELQVAAVYQGFQNFDESPSARGVQVRVHYSISELPRTGYTPRKADDRIGYFLTVVKDFSNRDDEEHFVRYINRWNLKKKDASISLSPPEEPIVFYIEKTVPVALRPTVRAGILEWNKAFREIGFDGAIEVRQQRDDDTWDPEDIRYNTFRWITANAGFAMGPSRINPRTGQILDADIIFDASFLDSWRREYESFTDETARGLLPAWPDRHPHDEGFAPLEADALGNLFGGHSAHRCRMCDGMQHQFGFGAAALATRGLMAAEDGGRIAGLPRDFVHQGLKEVVMHEVGHTLGLRHNFKASAWKGLGDLTAIDDPSVPTVASVMDYAPANITAGEQTGLYYTQTLGPYDMWAIEYGYKQYASASKERKGLEEIAARSGEPGLAYLTDEDTRMTGSDPLSNLFDLGDDPVEYAARQMDLSESMLDGIVDRVVEDGEGYQRARQAFGLVLSEYFRSALFATRFVGGVHASRDHYTAPDEPEADGEDDENANDENGNEKDANDENAEANAKPEGDAEAADDDAEKNANDAKPQGEAPYRIVTPEQQRKAMSLVSERIFQAPKIDGPMLNRMPTSHWMHWGTRFGSRGDYPIHDVVKRMQSRVLFELTSPTTLHRLLDNAYKTPEGEDAYELPEHFRLLTQGTFGEVLEAARAARKAAKAEAGDAAKDDDAAKDGDEPAPLAIDSFRRGLQRTMVKELAFLMQSPVFFPDDARTLARLQMQRIGGSIATVLEADLELDDLTRAHLMDTQHRIRQALSAEVQIRSID